MRMSRLPNLRFHSEPVFTFKKIMKSFLLAIVIGLIAVASYVVMIVYTQNVHLQQQTLMMSQNPRSDSVLIQTTADIISREGNIPKQTATSYAMWIYEAGAVYAVDPILILSVMQVESKFDYKAISPTGPIGLLQVAWSWHKEKTTKAELFDPKTNIIVGTQILREYKNLSKSEIETLLRYNGSLGAAPVYAVKVLGFKKKYETEIMKAVALSI